MDLPLISIVSVNYNQPDHTREFLDSIYQSDYPNIEVILVDNGSENPIDANLESEFSHLRCIFSKRNLGFAGGNNIGLKKAKGEFIFLLNNDTILQKNFFCQMVSFFSEHKDAGIASPKILYPSGRLQYAGSKKINPITGRGGKIGWNQEDKGQFDQCYPTAYPHGAAMVIRREVLETVGLMPEEYFLYYEELDWTNTIRKSGFEVYYVGTSSITHKESISVGKESPLKLYYLNRNRLLYLKRNSSTLEFFLGSLFYLFVSLPKHTFSYLMNGEYKQLRASLRGLAWHINKKYVFNH
ncbi:MAG: glycosyltransferase family 2 protein [Ekhidna sp.]